MIERKIISSKKDSLGNITAVCNPGEWWSPRSSEDVINDIEDLLYEYFVIVDGAKVKISVVLGATGKYLRTDPDKTIKNNLDYLPDC
jgi:hypothetical protein